MTWEEQLTTLLCEGQIEGAVHMGLGYALSEGFPCDEVGKPENLTLKSLSIIRPKDMPEVEVILVESPQPNSPYGIKGSWRNRSCPHSRRRCSCAK